MAEYVDKEIGAKGVGPHVYAMGEAAYKHVKRHKTPAALVIELHLRVCDRRRVRLD